LSHQFNICLIPEEDGRWTAEVPTLPGCVTWGNTKEEAIERIKEAIGCVTWGNTKEEAIERIKEAIELYIEVMNEEGKPVPVDQSTFTKIEIAL